MVPESTPQGRAMEQTHTSHNGTTATPGAQRRVLVVEGVERRVDEHPLRASVGGVHKEAAVGDDLEQLAVAPQDYLSVRALATVQDFGNVVRGGHRPILAGTASRPGLLEKSL